MKRLIVTADDVGLHRGMTLGAIEAHRRGVVTACSVVANGRELGHAVELLGSEPALSVGIHLTLVEEKPLSPPDEIPSLVDGDRFVKSYIGFARRYALGRIRIEEVEREFRAQFEKLLASRLRVVHANGHQHLHLLPRIFDVVLRLCEEYGVRYVRTVSELQGSRMSPRALSLRALSHLGRRAASRSDRFAHPDRTTGIFDAGHFTAAKLERLIGTIQDGLTELVCHPGIDDSALASAYDWGYEWDAETRALCDPRVRAALNSSSVELVSPSGL